jgi:hypothetical protein
MQRLGLLPGYWLGVIPQGKLIVGGKLLHIPGFAVGGDAVACLGDQSGERT